RSSARSANASTSVSVLTVRVEAGNCVELGSKAQVSNSSPQKSLGPRVIELKNPDLPPFVVELSSCPLMIKSISLTGSSSRTTYVPIMLRVDTRRSHIASSNWSSICSKNGTCAVRRFWGL
uniref:Uncharacterized protein n=1 Tax=Solanum lycopersicum TaxID=4081 RepID=A0A3Q7F9S9_SOLLC